ncbi:MAG: hypothetical protein ACK47B_19555 [Armatimonadota bacterium]
MKDRGNAKEILLVHPDTRFRATLRQVLEEAGHRVEVVADAPAAQERLRAEPPPALLLLGDGMPPESVRRPGVPVIRLVGGASAAGETAEVAVLERPLDVDELLTTVQQHLPE